MAPGTPIQFTLYGPNDEIVSTHSRAVITSRFLERAIDLQETMKQAGQTKEILEALDQLVVDFFGGQFTLEQIKDGGDFGEKISVLYAIINRAAGLAEFSPGAGTPNQANRQANPTNPGKLPRRRRRNGS